MAARAGVRTNAAEVGRDLERLGGDMQRDALIPGMRDFTRDVARTARTTGFRSRSGRLARSIVADEPKARPGGRVRGGVSAGGRGVEYAPVIEYGYSGRRSFLRAALRKLGARRYVQYVDRAVAAFVKRRGF